MDKAHRTTLSREGWGGETALATLRLKLGLGILVGSQIG